MLKKKKKTGPCSNQANLNLDLDLKKKDLESMAGISHYTINKLNKGENITTDILGKICKALGCNIDDIMEFVEEETNDD